MTNSSEGLEVTAIRQIGTNVILRPWRLEDKQSLIENANNHNVSINLRDQFPYPYTGIDADEWLNIATVLIVHRNQYFAIEVENKAVGGISIEFGKDVHRYTAELGYWLGESYWNRGLMSEAVKLMKDYAFNSFPQLQRLYAGPFSCNLSSTKVLEKAGFRFEGRSRKTVVNRDGTILDQLVYSFIRD
jgi:ribosomal-protein-alanine N-acetyltransferase